MNPLPTDPYTKILYMYRIPSHAIHRPGGWKMFSGVHFFNQGFSGDSVISPELLRGGYFELSSSTQVAVGQIIRSSCLSCPTSVFVQGSLIMRRYELMGPRTRVTESLIQQSVDDDLWNNISQETIESDTWLTIQFRMIFCGIYLSLNVLGKRSYIFGKERHMDPCGWTSSWNLLANNFF